MSLSRLASLGLLALAACSSTSKARPDPSTPPDTLAAKQEGYGFSPENPIHVGGGPEGQQAFLDTLRGPEGEPLTWRRLGSCCQFDTPNGIMGVGLLDLYEVSYEGMDRPVILYLDMYDSEPVSAPSGFTLSTQEADEEKPPKKPKVIEL